MRRFRSIERWSALLVSAWLLWLMPTSSLAQQPERQTYDLGTAAAGGLSHPLGVTIAALIKLKLLPQANIDIDTRNTGGSRDNALGLRSLDLDFGVVSNIDAQQAFRGIGSFKEAGADDGIRLQHPLP